MPRPALQLPFAGALLAGAGGGLLLSRSFPAHDWWWAAIPALAAIVLALRGRTIHGALAVGIIAGEAFYLPLISWSNLFLGPVPWAALATVESLFFMVGALALNRAQQWWPSRWNRRGRRWPLVFLLAGLWLLREVWSNHWPYGGFAWGRVGQSQAAAPWAGLYSWIGVSGVSFLIVALAAGLLEVIDALRDRSWRPAVVWAIVLGLVSICPAWKLPIVRTATVAAVQGGSEKAGYFKQGEPGQIRDLHAQTTLRLPHAQHYDLIVWPETAAEWDSNVDAETRQLIQGLAATYHTTLFVGAVRQEQGNIYNTVEAWDENGSLGRFDKRNPVPFGEYIPDREFWAFFDPVHVGMIKRGYSFGTTPAVVHTPWLRFGTGICFDVIDDALMRESVRDGAEALIYPTNNADFGLTAELDQQILFARLRAMESGRSVVQVSTVGHTRAYGPLGEQLGSVEWYTAATMTVELPITTGMTPAIRYARALAGFITSASGLVLIALGTHRYRRVKRQ